MPHPTKRTIGAIPGVHPHLSQRPSLDPLWPCNFYLIAESDSFTLIDATIAGFAKDILSAPQSIKHDPIRQIFLTHANGDDFGSLDALGLQVGGAEPTFPPPAPPSSAASTYL